MFHPSLSVQARCVRGWGGGGWRGALPAHDRLFILTILYVFCVSVFLDGEGTKRWWWPNVSVYPIGTFLTYNVNFYLEPGFFFFLKFSVELFRIFNEVVYSLKVKKKKKKSAIFWLRSRVTLKIWRTFVRFFVASRWCLGWILMRGRKTGQSKTFWVIVFVI